MGSTSKLINWDVTSAEPPNSATETVEVCKTANNASVHCSLHTLGVQKCDHIKMFACHYPTIEIALRRTF